ncbi:hypothetical protein K413DRAFT_3007 [Clostridium sp. ASBs410]|nr:hypothetical protein K413DRAFT_3007 [Clostridium sp. ASBs410]
MDKKHFRVILYIYRHPYVAFGKVQSKFTKIYDLEDMLELFRDEDKLFARTAESQEVDEGEEDIYICQTSHLVCTPICNEYVENRIGQNRQWHITTGIALFATIGAFREELAYILQAITKPLK